jgi:hypothetical protein
MQLEYLGRCGQRAGGIAGAACAAAAATSLGACGQQRSSTGWSSSGCRVECGAVERRAVERRAVERRAVERRVQRGERTQRLQQPGCPRAARGCEPPERKASGDRRVARPDRLARGGDRHPDAPLAGRDAGTAGTRSQGSHAGAAGRRLAGGSTQAESACARSSQVGARQGARICSVPGGPRAVLIPVLPASAAAAVGRWRVRCSWWRVAGVVHAG